MMKGIKAQISDKAEVMLEFVGFRDKECTYTREKVQKLLLEFGVNLNPNKIIKKNTSQISHELSEGEVDSETLKWPIKV
jgi:hypothetical protein